MDQAFVTLPGFLVRELSLRDTKAAAHIYGGQEEAGLSVQLAFSDLKNSVDGGLQYCAVVNWALFIFSWSLCFYLGLEGDALCALFPSLLPVQRFVGAYKYKVYELCQMLNVAGYKGVASPGISF